jgi:hypothetical protein
VYEPSLVAKRAITSNKHVICDCLPENFNFEYIGDNLLRLAVDVWMNECDVVVACDDIAKGRETLVDTLDGDGVR